MLARKRLIPAYDANGKAWHSWRVLILPYFESNRFYGRHDRTEPWNRPLVIDSEVADVRVKVLEEGHPVRDLEMGLEAVMEATSERSAKVTKVSERIPISPRARLTRSGVVPLEWPSMNVETRQRNPFIDRFNLADFSSEDWMAYLIHHTASAVATEERRAD